MTLYQTSNHKIRVKVKKSRKHNCDSKPCFYFSDTSHLSVYEAACKAPKTPAAAAATCCLHLQRDQTSFTFTNELLSAFNIYVLLFKLDFFYAGLLL